MRLFFQALFAAAVAIALYANTIGHDYAFDDGVVIRENAHVQRGFAGIGAIMTRDAFDSYFKQMSVDSAQLSGGRYRPLSIVTFAVEQGLFGDNPQVRHLVNVLLYGLTGALLLVLLRTQLLRDAWWALLATLLFIVHPIHTEAVANIKGRDELLSFLFIVGTLLFALRHDAERRTRDLVFALGAYLLALLSKEYGLVLLVLLPLAFYLRHDRGVFEALRRTVPYAAVAIVYVALRLNAIGFHMVAPGEILSNPYLYATVDQALATKLAVLLRYAALLVFPYPLSADYSYRQIPYVDFTSLLPWLSLAVHGAVLAWGVLLVRRRDIRAFAVFFYLGTLAIVSNVFIDIGAFMGERLVYHASLGFVLIVAWAALAVARRAGGGVANTATDNPATATAATPTAIGRAAGITLVVISAVVMVAASAWTIERNRDWKNDFALFTRDVVTAPNSAVLNANASLYFLAEAEKPENAGRREALLKSAIAHLEKAIEIHPKFASAHINLGLALFRLDRLDDAEREWRLAEKLRARDPVVAKNLVALGQTYFNRGLDDGSSGRFEPALVLFDKAVRLDPGNAAIWTNIGKSRYWLKDYAGAREAWEQALKLEPGRRDAISGLAVLGKNQ